MQVYSLSQKKVIDVPDTSSGTLSIGATPDFLTQEQDNYKQYIKNAVSAQDSKAAEDLASEFKSTYGFDVFGENPSPTAKTQQAEKTKLGLAADSATKVLDILKNRSAYKTDKEYQTALEGAVSDYNSKRAFGEAGKTVSATERIFLGGQLVDQILKGPNIGQKAIGAVTGEVPAPSSRINEDEDTLKAKMIQAILRADPSADTSQYENIQTSKDLPAKDFWTTSSGEVLNQNYTENFVNNAIDIVKGLPALAKVAYNLTPIDWVVKAVKGEDVDMLSAAKTTVELGKGMLMGLAEVTGVKNNIGLDADGHFYWHPDQQVKDALIHDANHPIDTVLWLLPFLKGSPKGGSAIIDDAIEKAPATEEAVIRMISPKAGKAATSVAVPIPESVVKSEEIMSKALQITKSKTLRGMAKELETSVANEGRIITARASELDKVIGPQPVGEIVNEVMNKVADTSSAKANPKLLQTIQADLERELSKGPLPEGVVRGEFEATSLSKMNEARMYFSSNLNNWFDSGRPVGTPTNDLNAMRYEAAQTLKSLIGESDPEGVILQSLDKQHIAFETYPVLSKEALKASPGVGSIGYRWGLIRKAWEATGAKAMEELRIINARKLQGEYVPPTPPKIVGSGVLPETPPETLNPQPVLPGNRVPLSNVRARGADTSRWTTSTKLPENIAGSTIKRDLRTKTWEPKPSTPLPETPADLLKKK